jgi:hypothetical protein
VHLLADALTIPGVVLLMVSALVVGLASLTRSGSKQRGASIVLSTLAGLGFPVTWVAWYVADRRAERA